MGHLEAFFEVRDSTGRAHALYRIPEMAIERAAVLAFKHRHQELEFSVFAQFTDNVGDKTYAAKPIVAFKF